MMTSSLPTTSPLAKLSTRERTALLTQLADEDSAVYEATRKKILSFGAETIDWLRPHAISSDAVLRRHVLEIIGHFERKHADNQFLTFCLKHGEEFDLETGAWL